MNDGSDSASAPDGSAPEVGGRVDLRWDPDPADWSDALRAVVPMYRWSPWFAATLAAFSGWLLVSALPWPGVFGLVCAVVIAALPLLAVQMSFRRNPVAGSPVTASVDERSVRMMTVDGTAYSDLPWSELAGWVRARRGFVLHAGPDAVYPVPDRAFTEQAERDRFAALLHRRLGAAARP